MADVFPYPGDDPGALSAASSNIDCAHVNMTTFSSMFADVKSQLTSAWQGPAAAKAQGDLGKVDAMLPTITRDLASAKTAIDILRAGLVPIRNEIDTLRTKYVNLQSQLQGEQDTYARAGRFGEANDMTPSDIATYRAGIATAESHLRTQLAGLQNEYDQQVTKANLLTQTCQDALQQASQGNTHYAGSTLTTDSLSTQLGLGGLDLLHDAQMAALAKRYADELNKVDTTDGKGAAEYHKVATEIGPYLNDPAFAAAFVGEVGPQRMQLIPDFLYASGSSTAGQDLKAFSQVFGTAVSNDTLDPRVKAVETAFLTPPQEAQTSWFRAAMCSSGTFPATFLASAARVNALDDFAKNGQQGFGGMGFRGEPNGMDFVQQMDMPSDAVALWTQDLATNPAAARDALATMGSDNPSVDISQIPADQLPGDYAGNIHKLMMYGSGDQVPGMAQATGDLFVAASGANEPDGSHSPDAVNFAKGFFDNFGNNPKDGDGVPPVVAGDYAKIGGAYVQEMAGGSQLDGSQVGDVHPPLTGQTPAFGIPPETAKAMMRSFVGDPDATKTFDNAAGAQYQAAQLAAAKLDAGLPAAQQENLNNAAQAYGSVAGAENSATHALLGERDEQAESDNELVKGVLSAGLDLIPGEKIAEDVPGTAWDVFKHLGNMGLEHAYGATSDPRFDATTDASHALALTGAYNNLSVLQQAGYPGTNTIPADLIDPSTGHMYPPSVVLKNQDLQQSFHDYMSVGGGGDHPGSETTSVYHMATNAGNAYQGGFDTQNSSD